jgi:ATP-binding cassette subfamily B protein
VSTVEAPLVISVRDRADLLKRLRWVGRGPLAALILVTLIGSAVPAATAVAFARLIGTAGSGAVDNLVQLAVVPLLVYLVILLMGHVLGAVREPLWFLAQVRIDGEHRAQLARLVATGETIGEVERPEVQMLIRQARADPESFVEGTLGTGVLAQLDLLGRILGVLSASAVLAAYAWWLVPLLVLPAAVIQRHRSWEAWQWMRAWRGTLRPGMHADVWTDALVSPGEGKEVRIFGIGDWAVDRIRGHLRGGYDELWLVGKRVLASQWRPLLLVIGPLGVAYLAVTASALRGASSVAVAAAVFAAGASVYQTLADTPSQTINAIACLTALNRLRRELGRGPDQDVTGAVMVVPDTPPLILFKNVGFTYPGTDRRVLDRLDLEIKPGELLGIVGANGAGKSTLIKLLARLYRPTCGQIIISDTDLADLDGAGWRSRVAIVFQDFVRYHLSAADNVALGNAAVPRDESALVAAARDAGLDEVLGRLLNGWDTPLVRSRTGGVDLSGGQWQQVVLARALYAVRTGAVVLVLDEPTAHLDVKTELDVFGRLAAHKGNATVVLISHRLSSVRRADRIALLSEGRIAELGSHDALMARDGQYARMFAIQAERFNRGDDDRIDEGELI